MLTYLFLGLLNDSWNELRDSNNVEFDDVVCVVMPTVAFIIACPSLLILDVCASPLEAVTYIIYRVMRRKSDDR